MISRHTTKSLLFLVIVLLLGGCSRSETTSANGESAGDGEAQSSGTAKARKLVGFASPERLAEHYQKHGSEFGTITMEEYLRRAQALRDSPVGDDVLEIVRADGVITRFERSSGSFIAFNHDGIIRTYFRPNQGETYFRRQGQR